MCDTDCCILHLRCSLSVHTLAEASKPAYTPLQHLYVLHDRDEQGNAGALYAQQALLVTVNICAKCTQGSQCPHHV